MGLLSNGPEYDCVAWEKYPQHRHLFNKLELSLRLGYTAGPGGVPVPQDGHYVVRPIYNLSGMGAQAHRKFIKGDVYDNAPPGHFWCEYFGGAVTTIDYEWQSVDGHTTLVPVFAARGVRASHDLQRFSGWKKIQPPCWPLPAVTAALTDVPRINIEYIDGKIIEIHLRAGVDFPTGSTELIPVWRDMTSHDIEFFLQRGWQYQEDFDDADGWLETPRLGFLYK